MYGKIINKKYKIDFNDYNGWFFTIGEIHSKKDILFKQSINTNHKYSIYLIKKVWNKYL